MNKDPNIRKTTEDEKGERKHKVTMNLSLMVKYRVQMFVLCIAAKDDEIKTFGARQGQIQMELDRLVTEIDTLPEYFGQLKSSLGTALFGADEEKIMALKEKQPLR